MYDTPACIIVSLWKTAASRHSLFYMPIIMTENDLRQAPSVNDVRNFPTVSEFKTQVKRLLFRQVFSQSQTERLVGWLNMFNAVVSEEMLA